MKIEIAENMLYSWLRHCKGCQIVQTNFKKSDIWKNDNEKEVKDLYDSFQLESSLRDCKFGNKEHFETIMKQTECDLLAISYDSENKGKIFAVESAFHEGGLGYKNSEKKVIQKLFRNILIIRSYFPFKNVELIFATPKVSKPKKENILAKMELLKKFLEKEKIPVTLKLIVNEQYQAEIVEPLCREIDKIADDNELFVRAMKLTNPKMRKGESAQRKKSGNLKNMDLKVGYIVKTRLYDCLKSMKSLEEITNLTKEKYCRDNFKLNYPVLRTLELGRNDTNQKPRYYTDSIKINKQSYYVTNDWYEKNKRKLLEYLENHGF